jgi:CBS domain-containing protein/sporulation protein YlmC with PRC-barrel domain
MPEEIALSSILGASVYDSTGAFAGHVREVAIFPQDDPNRISDFVVKTKEGDRLLPSRLVKTVIGSSIQVNGSALDWTPLSSSEGMLLLERDLLDQQIIDVSGRKVVRVNDVDLLREQQNGTLKLRVGRVDIGLRGAIRRLLKGLAPGRAVEALAMRMPEKSIPWEAVDLIETDPARRVRLRLAYDRLSKLHPADIADILEELAPAEREAVFGSLNQEVAAEALEEIDPKMQIELMRSIDSDKAADIVEEMEPEERQEVSELLAFHENSAAGRMTTDYIALSPEHTVGDAIDRLRSFEGPVETISSIYLVDAQEKLVGSVPLVSLVLASGGTRLGAITPDHVIFVEANASDKDVAEMFDKYNLLTLPVVDEEQRLAGIITADDIISLLRDRI